MNFIEKDIVDIYTIDRLVFEKRLHDIYSGLLEKFEERTPLSLEIDA